MWSKAQKVVREMWLKMQKVVPLLQIAIDNECEV
jgi:hypothetical protein